MSLSARLNGSLCIFVALYLTHKKHIEIIKHTTLSSNTHAKTQRERPQESHSFGGHTTITPGPKPESQSFILYILGLTRHLALLSPLEFGSLVKEFIVQRLVCYLGQVPGLLPGNTLMASAWPYDPIHNRIHHEVFAVAFCLFQRVMGNGRKGSYKASVNE